MSTTLYPLKTIVLMILLLAAGAAYQPVAAQESFSWSYPQRIPSYDNHSRPPFLVPDQDQTLHVFNFQPVDAEKDAIFYRRWSPGKGWSVPVDILLVNQGLGGQVIQGALLDKYGELHLIYQDESTIRYSRALASIADRSPSWLPPITIAEDAGPLASAGFVDDGKGRMTVVYCGSGEGIGLYEIHSTDWGNTWSEPEIVSLIFNQQQLPTSVRLIRDSQGGLDLTWTDVNTELGVGEGIYFSRLDNELAQWSTPILLADRGSDDYSANWASLIDDQDGLILVYQDGFPPTKWMRRSQDNGRTWTIPVRLFPHQGEYEFPVLLKDGHGGLHMILGNRIGYPETHGMWHSRWINGSWTNPEPVITGPKTPEFDPSAPKAVFLQGNILFATWWNDTDYEHRNGAWFSFETFNFPALPLTSLPSPTDTPLPATPTSEAQNPQSLAETSTPRPAWAQQVDKPVVSTVASSPSIPIILGIIPALFLIFLALIVSRLSYRSRFNNRE